MPPGPYDRKLDPVEPYAYTVGSDTGYTSAYDEPPALFGGYPPKPYEPAPPASLGYADPPSSPAGTYSSPAKETASGPTDGAIDAMMAANGGRITSKMMRQLERQTAGGSGSSKLPQWPPAPVMSATEQKRQKIMSGIPKTKTTDTEGGDLSFAGKDGGGLAGKKLVDHYKGEDKSLAWRTDLERWAGNKGLDPKDPEVRKKWEARRDSDSTTTRYDTTPESRETSRLKEKQNGKVKTTHDKPEDQNSTEHGWVMSPDTGDIHTFDQDNHVKGPDGKKVNMHHSSPLAGGNVAGAGMMTIEHKHITNITDESGHYRPEGEYTHQAVNEMAKRGLLDRKADRWDRAEYESGPGNLSARVTLSGAEGRDGRPGKGWLNDEDGIYKGNLTLPYQAFLQTRGNERQARAKVSMQDELLGKVPQVAPTTEGPGRAGASSLGLPAAPRVRRQIDNDPNSYSYDSDDAALYDGNDSNVYDGGYVDRYSGSSDGVYDDGQVDHYSEPDIGSGVELLPGYGNVDIDGNVFDPFSGRR